MTDARPILLKSRALIKVRGPDWRSFLHNLLTCEVQTLVTGEGRFGALLTPQGRLLHDVFVIAEDDGALIDVERDGREDLLKRLALYRLRAKVEVEPDERSVAAAMKAPASDSAGAWIADPRMPALGWRGYGAEGEADEAAYDAHRLALGAPGPADWGTDSTYPIEANFDLLNGIDFKKGCFVGQETTSRMKRRGAIKNRMLPIDFDGPPPPFGSEVLAGDLRAGEVLSGRDGRAMALLRLDRIQDARLTAGGQTVRAVIPDWCAGEAGG